VASLSLSRNTEFVESNILCFFQLLCLLSECLRSHGFRSRRDRSSVAVVIRYFENRFYRSGVVIVSVIDQTDPQLLLGIILRISGRRAAASSSSSWFPLSARQILLSCSAY
jgi:hypothetical protein